MISIHEVSPLARVAERRRTTRDGLRRVASDNRRLSTGRSIRAWRNTMRASNDAQCRRSSRPSGQWRKQSPPASAACSARWDGKGREGKGREGKGREARFPFDEILQLVISLADPTRPGLSKLYSGSPGAMGPISSILEPIAGRPKKPHRAAFAFTPIERRNGRPERCFPRRRAASGPSGSGSDLRDWLGRGGRQGGWFENEREVEIRAALPDNPQHALGGRFDDRSLGGWRRSTASRHGRCNLRS
jgi:hypothetical protein